MSELNGNPPTIRLAKLLSPLKILSVDGKIQGSNPVLLAPGIRSVVLQSGRGPNPDRQYQMLIAPCTRYYLAAEREAVTSRTWEMKIVSSEQVGACDPAEERRKAGI